LHWGVAWTRAALALGTVVALALLALSGGSGADPRTPPGLAGMPEPFLGTAVAGSGKLTAAVDAYGDVVDLRIGPAGAALIDNPAARQTAGTVDTEAGIVPRLRVGDGPALPLWRADGVRQRYLAGTNVVRTVARFGAVEAIVTVAARGRMLAVDLAASAPPGVSARTSLDVGVAPADWRLCLDGCGGLIRAAAEDDRRWLAAARPLGPGAPPWARQMYRRSLLTLRALTDRESGAVAAGARDGWAYVWPRDAATAALAFAAAGYEPEAERVVRFLLGADLEGAARFHGDGSPVAGRAAQGDAIGWTAVAAEAAGLIGSARHAARILSPSDPIPWRGRADYQEGEPGDYLANAIASGADLSEFRSPTGAVGSDTAAAEGLVRRAGDPRSGLDSAAAWAVRPFSRPALYPQVRRTLLRLAAEGTRFGITPGEAWGGGEDPWSAQTAWSAWSLAALGNRREALALLGDLRRAATPAGALPERVGADTGVPASTTPLAWPHAFAILALRELWP
jgi:hypothetical protein